MKKIIKLLICLFILILFFELITYLFKTHHEITYDIKDDKIVYKINEIYKNKKYYIKIENINTLSKLMTTFIKEKR